MNTYSDKFRKYLIIICLIILAVIHQSYAQTYQVNGSATDNGNGIVKLTSQGIGNQTASVWNTAQIDLTQAYDMTFELFFGCDKSADGGDGMTFTLHNDPQGRNATGAGFGFLGVGGNPVESVSPSISIEFDTYDGTAAGGLNEIPQDHIAVNLNGNVNAGQSFIGIEGTPVTVQEVLNGRDLEDCAVNANNFYTIRIVWNPVTQQLQLYEEGVLTMTYTNDLINNVFAGNTMVYWGFTGATGTASNEQWIASSGSIIPWECSVANSCCAPFTITPTSPTTICNNAITLSVADAYNAYSWSDGSTNATLQVAAPGTYTLRVLQNQGGNTCPGSIDFTIIPVGPTATLSGGATLCNAEETTPLAVALTGTAPWSLTYAIDGLTQAPVTSIATSPYVFQGMGSNVYSLVSVSDNSGCNSNVTGSATVDLFPEIPVGNDNVFVAPGAANLSVNDAGGTYLWYDAPTGGNLVFTGNVFTTPVLTANTTYYVENSSVIGYTQKSVGLLNLSEGTGNDVNDHVSGLPPAVCYLEFTAHSDFILDTITCLVNVPAPTINGRVTVYITPYVGTAPYTGIETIAKDSINISISTTGQHNILIPLHYACTAGTTYHISYGASNNIQTEMYFQLLPAVGGYPLNTDPELSITQYDPGRPGRYPGLFDWKISVPTPASSCGRTPVKAYQCPTAVLSGDATICDDGVETTNLSIVLTGDAPWFITYAVDGVNQTPISGITASPYVFSSLTGAHVYTLVSVHNATSNGCPNETSSGTAHVLLKPDAPKGNDVMFTPPSRVNLQVENTGGVYNWFSDATGNNLIHVGATYTTPLLNSTTTYYVEQVAGLDTSCSRTAITAIPFAPTEALFIPNLITPNNDGKNDVFEIRGLPKDSELLIYNRWGKSVYMNTNYDNEWDPSNDDAGIYYYELKLKNGENYKGWLQVL